MEYCEESSNFLERIRNRTPEALEAQGNAILHGTAVPLKKGNQIELRFPYEARALRPDGDRRPLVTRDSVLISRAVAGQGASRGGARPESRWGGASASSPWL